MGFWHQRTKSEKTLLIGMVLVAIICIPILFAPSGSSKKGLLPEAEARLQYEKARTTIDQKSKEIIKLRPEVDRLTYKDAPESIIPAVIRSLQTTANASGIHIREIKPLRVRRVAGLTKVPLSVRFSCDFSKTVPFLYSAEDPANKLVIDRLNVTAPDAKSRMVDVEAHVAFFTTSTATVATDNAAAGGT